MYFVWFSFGWFVMVLFFLSQGLMLGWPHIHWAVEDDLELLILQPSHPGLPPLPVCVVVGTELGAS